MDAVLIVEEINGIFHLIAGYPDLVLYQAERPETEMPCKLFSYKNDQERYLALFYHLIKQSKRVRWADKHCVRNHLNHCGLDDHQITKNLGLTLSEVKKYTIIQEVPAEFSELAVEREAATTVNEMGRFFAKVNQLQPETENYLFYILLSCQREIRTD